ncbi:MAG: glycosyltransferase, partial [Methylophilaceae bacterium]|nr:glycosyltransferase [Methylophilaceae bacterium]
VELVVVDGASPDNTPEVMAPYVLNYPEIHYFRELENSGIDADYDKAVGYATGKYCWLMTDDDLLKPGAIKCVLAELDGLRDLVVVNAETRNVDLAAVLVPRQLVVNGDRNYSKDDSETFFSECANYLSFIGGVVIRREFWLERDRKSFYGSLFVHVGVIFQQPRIGNVYVIADPQIVVRYGNAMWTSRGFEIWSFKWQELVWSFDGFSDESKRRVCHPAPWKRIKTLFYYRATGAYSEDEFEKFIYSRTNGISRFMSHGIALFPAAVANIISVFYFTLFHRTERMMQYDLLRSRHASGVSRWLAKTLWK